MPFITDYPGKVSKVVSDYNYGVLTAIQAGKRVSSVTRSTEGKTWTIIGTVGDYLIIRTTSHGDTRTRLIYADDYQRCDRYREKIPVMRYPESKSGD